ncbi:MAG: aminoacyl-tRNA hydrolase [Candidatus Cloacimonetes bacterium]|nr:aminoacyl-tRNA hydrolase [Candidatus Cloacimonadota bacterium]
MKLIAGLGNPGAEYQLNRHNIGFIILDRFAKKRKLNFKQESNSLIAKRNNFTLVKPLTYMNLSGLAIKKLFPDFDETIVICDDINLPFAEIRLRQKGGDGGHNGLKSIIHELGTANFMRIRIGVGEPENQALLKKYVLEDFNINESLQLEKIVDFSIQLIDCFIARGFQSMLDFYSKNKKSYSESLISESKTKGGT